MATKLTAEERAAEDAEYEAYRAETEPMKLYEPQLSRAEFADLKKSQRRERQRERLVFDAAADVFPEVGHLPVECPACELDLDIEYNPKHTCQAFKDWSKKLLAGHVDHGMADPHEPTDGDCPCRGTNLMNECAGAGCCFCVASTNMTMSWEIK